MNIYPSFTNLRSHLSHRFLTLQTSARREALWDKLMGKNTALALFPDEAPEKSPNRTYVGTEDIPVEKIVGTVSRRADFDHKFRPLHRHLRDRWVDVYLALESAGWPPILVHKVGENYYVEDGHHRVSVAQLLGMTFLPARVWEYPCLEREQRECLLTACIEINAAKAYATVAD